MPVEPDSTYFYQRAEAELKLAQQATQPAVVKPHYQLAGYYLDRVYGEGDVTDVSPDGRVVAPLSDAFRQKAASLAAQLRSAGVIVVGPSSTTEDISRRH